VTAELAVFLEILAIEDLELVETALSQPFVQLELSVSFYLVSDFEVLGSEQLMRPLGLRVGVVVLVLQNIEALQLHVLLSAGRGGFHAEVPALIGLVLGSLVVLFGLVLKHKQDELTDSEHGGEILFEGQNAVLESESNDIDVGDELLHL